MIREATASAPTTEAAVEQACADLGVSKDDVTFEVLTEPKKGFLGMGAVAAKVKVTYKCKPPEIALNFVRMILDDMNIKAETTQSFNADGDCVINITGDEAGALIGHHGDTLDALQYLCSLAANKKEDAGDEREFTRIIVDIGGYRVKREDTLRSLARRMAERAKKIKRSVALEPMPAHERRIIHAEVQKIDGVTTGSVGVEGNRKVIIYPERKPADKRDDG